MGSDLEVGQLSSSEAVAEGRPTTAVEWLQPKPSGSPVVQAHVQPYSSRGTLV